MQRSATPSEESESAKSEQSGAASQVSKTTVTALELTAASLYFVSKVREGIGVTKEYMSDEDKEACDAMLRESWREDAPDVRARFREEAAALIAYLSPSGVRLSVQQNAADRALRELITRPAHSAYNIPGL